MSILSLTLMFSTQLNNWNYTFNVVWLSVAVCGQGLQYNDSRRNKCSWIETNQNIPTIHMPFVSIIITCASITGCMQSVYVFVAWVVPRDNQAQRVLFQLLWTRSRTGSGTPRVKLNHFMHFQLCFSFIFNMFIIKSESVIHSYRVSVRVSLRDMLMLIRVDTLLRVHNVGFLDGRLISRKQRHQLPLLSFQKIRSGNCFESNDTFDLSNFRLTVS